MKTPGYSLHLREWREPLADLQNTKQSRRAKGGFQGPGRSGQNWAHRKVPATEKCAPEYKARRDVSHFKKRP